MVLLERETQLAELQAGLVEARRGRGSLALVSGEAGIGKTALVERFARRHGRRQGRRQGEGFRLLWGASDPLFTPRPLGPLHDMAPHLGDEVQEMLRSEAPRPQVFSAVLDVFRRRPTLAIFEDVHWADEGTFDLLRLLGRRVSQTSTFLVLTYRDDELDARHPLHILLGDLATSANTRRIPLPPLSPQAVQELALDKELDPAALHQQTGGNPFYVTEVLAGPESGIPPTVRDAVLARVARLSPSGLAVLEAAAVIGERMPPWLLAAVTGAEAPAAEECMAVGMLHSQQDGLLFRHELARQVVLASISPPRRQVLHRLVLDAMQSSPETRHDLARLAHHAEAAGDPTAILTYAPRAARQASAAGAHRGAVSLYELALRYAEAWPPADQAEMLDRYARELEFVARRHLALSARRSAVELWSQTDNTLKYGASLANLAFSHYLVGELDAAQQTIASALEALEALPASRALSRAYNTRALLCLADMEHRQGVAFAEKALELAEQLGDTRRIPWFQETLGFCWVYLDHVQGIRHLERGQAAAREIDLTERVANGYSNLTSLYIEFHQFERAEEYLSQGLAYAQEHDFIFSRLYLLAWGAYLNVLRGRWRAAEKALHEVLEGPHSTLHSQGSALIAQGRLRARRGDPGAEAALNEALEILSKLGFRQREGMIRAARAERAWLAGDPHQTRAEARAVYAVALDQRHPWVAGELAFWRWKAGDDVQLPEWLAEPYRMQIQGDWRAAAGAWETLGCPYERARALLEGDTAARIQALKIFERLEARPAADALRERLHSEGVRDLPGRPNVETRAHPFGLTPRQAEVLELLTEGLTNAEIGARLHISPRTAGHHVSAILAKLNVDSRHEAAELARQLPST